jgi:cytochrome c peroxidase
MQQRARFSLRHAGLLALAAIGLGPGCNQDGPLSDEEMAQLRGFMLPERLPTDTSNAYGDDLMTARLGKLLFFDGAFSGELGPYNVWETNGSLGNAHDPGKVSCASCHDPLTAGVDHRSKPNATSLGVSYTERNAPTVINAAHSPVWQFWDGRADSLWSQALSPPEGPAECGGSRLGVAQVLYARYGELFRGVFGANALPDDLADLTRFPPEGKPGLNPGCQPDDPGEPFFDAFDCMVKEDEPERGGADQQLVNKIYANFGKAIAAYERRLVSRAFEPSPFDAFMAGDVTAMSPAAIRGARLFIGRAGCAECHSGPMFTDYSFHNIGVPQTGQYPPPTDDGRYDGIGGKENVVANAFNRRGDFSDDRSETNTGHLTFLAPAPDSTRGQFKTPTLRNVGQTAPYMHNGVYQTLWDVVNHYNFGGSTGPYSGTKDPALAPLLLTDAELGDLVEFLRALDDGDVLDTHDFDQCDDGQGLLGKPKLPPVPACD